MKKVDKNFFPGWTRKSITFTIDDGNIALDRKFLNIVRPNGILGTFNLVLPDLVGHTPEFYREFYRGYEVTNHCKFHPFALEIDRTYDFVDEIFDEATADPEKVYLSKIPGLVWIHFPYGWRQGAKTEDYIRLAAENRDVLETVFGRPIENYVWPYHYMNEPTVVEYLRKNYKSIRKTGEVRDTTGFAFPADRLNWSYNAAHTSLLTLAEVYKNYPDDGELKFFCFGVHSHDFENSGNWCDLEKYAREYGNRPEEYYSASVGDLFAYEDAVKSVKITETAVENPSDLTVYIKIDGERFVLCPHCSIAL